MPERYRLEQLTEQPAPVRLRREGAPDWLATIEPHAGFACRNLRINGEDVLGQGGVRILFPWVGAVPARVARLRVGGTECVVGGGPAEGLVGDWTVEEVGEDARGAWIRATHRT